MQARKRNREGEVIARGVWGLTPTARARLQAAPVTGSGGGACLTQPFGCRCRDFADSLDWHARMPCVARAIEPVTCLISAS